MTNIPFSEMFSECIMTSLDRVNVAPARSIIEPEKNAGWMILTNDLKMTFDEEVTRQSSTDENIAPTTRFPAFKMLHGSPGLAKILDVANKSAPSKIEKVQLLHVTFDIKEIFPEDKANK